ERHAAREHVKGSFGGGVLLDEVAADAAADGAEAAEDEVRPGLVDADDANREVYDLGAEQSAADDSLAGGADGAGRAGVALADEPRRPSEEGDDRHVRADASLQPAQDHCSPEGWDRSLTGAVRIRSCYSGARSRGV